MSKYINVCFCLCRAELTVLCQCHQIRVPLNIFGSRTAHTEIKKGNKSKSTSVINSMADLDARAVGEESLRALRVVK